MQSSGQNDVSSLWEDDISESGNGMKILYPCLVLVLMSHSLQARFLYCLIAASYIAALAMTPNSMQQLAWKAILWLLRRGQASYIAWTQELEKSNW